jgi:hypothetical protein
MDGRVAAVGPIAVHGARHDAYAFEASGLKQIIAGFSAIGDLGYTGVDGITIVPIKRAAKCEIRDCDKEFNIELSKIRALVEQAVAPVKGWRMLSQEGGRYRAPIEKFEETLQAITGLLFFRAFGVREFWQVTGTLTNFLTFLGVGPCVRSGCNRRLPMTSVPGQESVVQPG